MTNRDDGIGVWSPVVIASLIQDIGMVGDRSSMSQGLDGNAAMTLFEALAQRDYPCMWVDG